MGSVGRPERRSDLRQSVISIPRYLKIARDDVMWDGVQDTRQSPKASGNELDRLEMRRRVDAATIQGQSENLKGEPLRRRVEEIAKLPPDTDARTSAGKRRSRN